MCTRMNMNQHEEKPTTENVDAGLLAGAYRPGDPRIEDSARTQDNLIAPAQIPPQGQKPV